MRRLGILALIVGMVTSSVVMVGSALASRSDVVPQQQRHRQASLTAMELAKGGGHFTTKIKVVHKKGEVLALVGVDVHGEELAFIVDTGAARSLVPGTVAKKLGLKKVGKPVTVAAAGCTSKAQNVEIENWDIAGHALPSLTVLSTTQQIAGNTLVGLLGSDVWSKFGAIRIDYANETLTVG